MRSAMAECKWRVKRMTGLLAPDVLASARGRTILSSCVVKEPAMCYLFREQQAGAAERGGATLPPSPDRLRPRLVGAVAVTLIGGLAVAAIVAPPSASPHLTARDSAATAPLAARAVAVPTTAVVGQGSAPVDDGVPSASDVVKSGIGDCDHGL
jgi:hypothetical protein